MKIIQLLAAATLATVLAACGGGGGSGGTPLVGTNSSTSSSSSSTTTTTSSVSNSTVSSVATAAAVNVTANSFSIPSGSGSSVITALVTDSNNNAIVGAPVSFGASSGVLTSVVGITGSNGGASATLIPGALRSNRNITVTATSGGVGSAVVVAVTGTSLSVSGPSSIATNGTVSIPIKLVDSTGINGIANQVLTVGSALGNLGVSSVTTDNLGNATIVYTGTYVGNDTVTISGAGTSASLNIAVATVPFVVISPSANQNIAVGTSYPVVFQYNGPLPQLVSFSSTQGTASPGFATTNGAVQVTVNVSSTAAGPALISASALGKSISVPVNFVSVTPANVILQMAPSYIGLNTGGSTANQSVATASVRDANNNPVAGQQVNFGFPNGALGGASLSPASATTNSNGVATANLIAGTSPTGPNQLIVSATVNGTSVYGTAAMTVGGTALNVKVSTDNLITPLTVTNGGVSVAYYQKNFLINVTDSNGVGVPNQSVSLGVYPISYGKGILAWTGTTYAATPTAVISAFLNAGQVVFCANEDPTGNSVLTSANSYLDLNGNGILDPGGPIVLTQSPVTTNSLGLAAVGVQYGQTQAPWIVYRITATVNVAGNQNSGSATLVSVGSSADFNSQSPGPAAVYSPYGHYGTCGNPN